MMSGASLRDFMAQQLHATTCTEDSDDNDAEGQSAHDDEPKVAIDKHANLPYYQTDEAEDEFMQCNL
jgi:hypothetical protein